MSVDLPQRRARRSTRFWLFAPAVVLFLVLAGSAGAWLWARARLVSEMDARAAALQDAGWTATWTDRTVSGFPFRLKIVLTDTRLRGPGDGAWGVSLPAMEAQAYVVEPKHWVFAAPQGLTVLRPVGGPLVVTGRALRASIAGIDRSPWRIALEGADLRFAQPMNAQPFSFTTVQHLEAHLRPTPDGSGDGDVLVTLDGAMAASTSFLAKLAPSAPIAMAASGRLIKLGEARGAGLSSAVTAWARAGGAVRLDRLDARAGPLHVDGKDALLGIDAAGFLEGAIPLAVTETSEAAAPGAAPAPITPATPAQAAAEAAASNAAVSLPAVFRGGRMTLGPADVGPAPKLR